jgi:hypothetical protein
VPHHALAAPVGMYRVIGVDTFEHPTEGDYLVGDFDTLEEAKRAADKTGGQANPVYVYDDKGKLRHEAGSK